MRGKDNKGFSLIELVIVMAILAVMGGVLIVTVGNIGDYKIKQYAELLDGFMRRTRTEAMAKNHICGVCIYQQDGRYYVESYGEETKNGIIEYKTVDVRELGSAFGIQIGISKKDGSDQRILSDNQGDTRDSCIRVKYATGTGAVSDITVDTASSMMDYTRIGISKGARQRWIEINTVTGKHTEN